MNQGVPIPNPIFLVFFRIYLGVKIINPQTTICLGEIVFSRICAAENYKMIVARHSWKAYAKQFPTSIWFASICWYFRMLRPFYGVTNRSRVSLAC